VLTADRSSAAASASQAVQHRLGLLCLRGANCRCQCQPALSVATRPPCSCDPAYSPLPWAMARLTWYGGVPMLLFSIACFYYCAMLTVGTAATAPALRLAV
jgi:hypothetical protein